MEKQKFTFMNRSEVAYIVNSFEKELTQFLLKFEHPTPSDMSSFFEHFVKPYMESQTNKMGIKDILEDLNFKANNINMNKTFSLGCALLESFINKTFPRKKKPIRKFRRHEDLRN